MIDYENNLEHMKIVWLYFILFIEKAFT